MVDYCVIVADASRARFFTMEAASRPLFESGPKLVEQKAFVNPETELPERETLAETRSGRQASRGNAIHSFDDHWTRHIEAFERRFARAVAEEARKLAGACKAKCMVLVASQRMIGLLRKELGKKSGKEPEIRDLASDIARKTPLQIQAHLAKAGLVPPCAAPRRRSRSL